MDENAEIVLHDLMVGALEERLKLLRDPFADPGDNNTGGIEELEARLVELRGDRPCAVSSTTEVTETTSTVEIIDAKIVPMLRKVCTE